MIEIFSNKVINYRAIVINILFFESCYFAYLGNKPRRQRTEGRGQKAEDRRQKAMSFECLVFSVELF